VGAVALIAVLFARGSRDKGTETANPETPTVATAQPAEPTTAAPAEPAAPAAVATEAPAPAMTAEIAPAEPAPAAPPNDTPAAAPKEKPAAPAIAAAKTETAAAPKEAKPAAPQPEKPAKAETKPAETKPAAPEPKEVAVGGDFDKAAAGTALTSAAQEASGCRKEGDPSGVAVVHVTFSNAGRATRAVIEGPPFAGTQTGGCIAATLRKATVPPYGGDRVTVTKKVVIR
jgi:outer membrane biosynthesis protein TonB